jgi:hypothetical protein
MSRTMRKSDDPFKFNKKTYWARCKAGITGQVSAPGSKKERYDRRKMQRKMMSDLKGGTNE